VSSDGEAPTGGQQREQPKPGPEEEEPKGLPKAEAAAPEAGGGAGAPRGYLPYSIEWAAKAAPQKGQRISMRFDDKEWYAGAITACDGEKKVLALEFEDGDKQADVPFEDGDLVFHVEPGALLLSEDAILPVWTCPHCGRTERAVLAAAAERWASTLNGKCPSCATTADKAVAAFEVANGFKWQNEALSARVVPEQSAAGPQPDPTLVAAYEAKLVAYKAELDQKEARRLEAQRRRTQRQVELAAARANHQPPSEPRSNDLVEAQGRGAATMPCSGCAVVRNVPEGATRCRCPQCAAVNEHGAVPLFVVPDRVPGAASLGTASLKEALKHSRRHPALKAADAAASAHIVLGKAPGAVPLVVVPDKVPGAAPLPAARAALRTNQYGRAFFVAGSDDASYLSSPRTLAVWGSSVAAHAEQPSSDIVILPVWTCPHCAVSTKSVSSAAAERWASSRCPNCGKVKAAKNCRILEENLRQRDMAAAQPSSDMAAAFAAVAAAKAADEAAAPPADCLQCADPALKQKHTCNKAAGASAAAQAGSPAESKWPRRSPPPAAAASPPADCLHCANPALKQRHTCALHASTAENIVSPPSSDMDMDIPEADMPMSADNMSAVTAAIASAKAAGDRPGEMVAGEAANARVAPVTGPGAAPLAARPLATSIPGSRRSAIKAQQRAAAAAAAAAFAAANPMAAAFVAVAAAKAADDAASARMPDAIAAPDEATSRAERSRSASPRSNYNPHGAHEDWRTFEARCLRGGHMSLRTFLSCPFRESP
jgi:hypothetical protein